MPEIEIVHSVPFVFYGETFKVYLAGRWARLNQGEPVPERFQSGHQPSLF